MTQHIQLKKNITGFALLNVMLGMFLLVGIVYLIMHSISHYHAEEKARYVGEELAPVISELITQSATSTSTVLCGTNALLANIPSGYLDSLKTSGFDLCDKDKTVVVFS